MALVVTIDDDGDAEPIKLDLTAATVALVALFVVLKHGESVARMVENMRQPDRVVDLRDPGWEARREYL